MRYALYNEEDGVFIGECLGLGFWSLLDAVGQDCAVTFKSEKDAQEYISTWTDKNIKLVPIETDNQYATKEECVKAGLPSWES